jgi:hypothetical protein
MATDKFATFTAAPGLPATSAFAITPNDAADVPTVTLALNVATPGVVRVTPLAGGTADVFIDAGVVFPLRVSRVWATGTTATGICGLC